MIYLLSFIVAMSISMAIIPLMIRAAPSIGMIDIPDSRKVHETPIPRVGGVGIVIGALVPVLLWTQHEPWLSSYIFGCIVLLVFGVWDDIKELGHYVKFFGQLLAVIPVVYYSDLYVSHLPFMGLDEISPVIGKPFTVFALLGMINAINHSDGLDGLAGGMSIISLVSIGYLAFLAEGYVIVSIVIATLGGIFGFLRFNNHPAIVFMGDGGSQFLGLTLGVLAIALTQETNPALSPALPALFLGLPIADILAVFWLRAYGGLNWFRATKNHIHHRLLELNFDHYESVIIIYSIQILFIISAILLRYESDLLIASIYIGVCAIVFILLTFGEHKNWLAHQSRDISRISVVVQSIKQNILFKTAPVKIIGLVIPAFYLVVVMTTNEVPKDLAISSVVLAIILLLLLIFSRDVNSILAQAIIYITTAFVVYIESVRPGLEVELLRYSEIVFFVLLAIFIGLAVRYSGENRFKVSPMDYLVVFIALFAGFLMKDEPTQSNLGFIAAKLVILFYGCEFIINHMVKRLNLLNTSVVASLLIMGFRGLA